MTGSPSETESPATRPISVAELLARNGTVGATAVTRRHRRRRRDPDAVTVAELTGEMPIIRDDYQPPTIEESIAPIVRQPAAADLVVDRESSPYWSTPEPRWPTSTPEVRPEPGPPRSGYPWPLRDSNRRVAAPEIGAPFSGAQPESGAERMSPDPVAHYAASPSDGTAAAGSEAELPAETSGYVYSYLSASRGRLFGGDGRAVDADRLASEPGAASAESAGGQVLAITAEVAEDDLDGELASWNPRSPGAQTALRGGVLVLQSILAVAFGAGLFIAFDQLWRWNNIVALVFAVLVILGLVLGVRVVRKTEDIGSTLIAVAVGALITLGPLALSQSG